MILLSLLLVLVLTEDSDHNDNDHDTNDVKDDTLLSVSNQPNKNVDIVLNDGNSYISRSR